jgi:aminomethyltransferase
MATDPKRTPLHDEHVRLGAKIIPFAGYEMPVQYAQGILAEHAVVRQRAGLFDVSHMGELEVRGERALDFVQYVATNDASRLTPGQAQYSALCQEDGGILDDCIVYRLDDHFMLVVNASNLDRDRDWICRFTDRFGVQVLDRSAETGLIAIQGPRAERILAHCVDADLAAVAYYHFIHGTVCGVEGLISRTGYTGEDGFELYLPAADTATVWRALLDAGQDDGLCPAGLGARDSLRLEVGYPLYGNDLDEEHTPFEAGLGWVTKLDKGDFIGRAALARQKEEGVPRRLVGFTLRERAFPRHGYEVRVDGEPAGVVTSGILSPSLDAGIGLAYVPAAAARPGTVLDVMVRNRAIPAEVTRPPFYRDGSVRR